MKCSSCGADAPINIVNLSKDGELVSTCMDCLEKTEEGVEPPLGWLSEAEKVRVMSKYAIIQWSGRPC